jgi:hypothetical protein
LNIFKPYPHLIKKSNTFPFPPKSSLSYSNPPKIKSLHLKKNLKKMDPLDILSNMQGLSPEFLSSSSTQQQMKSFWNMLDEMASNNPEVLSNQEYSKFIKSNLESGAEDLKLQSGKTRQSGHFAYCIKTYLKGKKTIVLINFCSCPK